MSDTTDEALVDPVGLIVRLVSKVEHGLDVARIHEVVMEVSGGRAKRRKLAQTLADCPQLLASGGPPVTWSVGQLLLGLRAAGATSTAAPRCGECGRTLTCMISRRGYLLCSRCRDTAQICAGCGHQRRVCTRDRNGQPRCEQCPDNQGDPIGLLAEAVCVISPDLEAADVIAALGRVTVGATRQRRLAWAIVDQPSLLTGAGSDAPAPAVLRFIDELLAAGASNILRPSCPRCGRTVALSKLLDGQRVCRTCSAHHRAVPCAGCGAVREPAARDAIGRPLCPNCLTSDPINLEDCRGCGRRRRVAARTPDGPWCQHCRPRTTATCGICGRKALCEISTATGKPWCDRCQSWWARCSGCHTIASIRGGTRKAPLCAKCLNPDPDFWKRCPTCKTTWQTSAHRPCHRCTLTQRADEVFAGPDGSVRPELAPLHAALIGIDRPVTAVAWLSRPVVARLLKEIAADQRTVTHDVLDELAAGQTLDHLRAVLVAGGILPDRDERLISLERWATRIIAFRDDHEERAMLHSYAIWHHLRRLRRRLGADHATHRQMVNVRSHTTAAVNFLDWLSTSGLTLATCTQPDLDQWKAGEGLSYSDQTGHFIRWATKNRLAKGLTFGTERWQGPVGPHDSEGRWDDARRLLHDVTLPTADRVAGLLLLFYAQRLSRISTLTVDQVSEENGQVSVRLGTAPTMLPEPLAALVLDLIATRRPYTVIGHGDQTPWLFPGQRPGQHVSTGRLSQRLIAAGIQPGQARSTALFALAEEVPAAILARMLGIHIQVAVQWQKASAGDWAAYAADVSRRVPEIR